MPQQYDFRNYPSFPRNQSTGYRVRNTNTAYNMYGRYDRYSRRGAGGNPILVIALVFVVLYYLKNKTQVPTPVDVDVSVSVDKLYKPEALAQDQSTSSGIDTQNRIETTPEDPFTDEYCTSGHCTLDKLDCPDEIQSSDHIDSPHPIYTPDYHHLPDQDHNLDVIQTQSGTVRGRTKKLSTGKEVDVYLGIPYAATTGGTNRFLPPQDVTPWEGVLSATDFSSPCYQVVPKQKKTKAWWLSAAKETEDCLKLNVWVPKPTPKKAAVMVWIHGGSFLGGSSDSELTDGGILASEENIVVVSFNFRLSVFGFLFLDLPEAPGNVVLLDQAAALRWVQINIAQFGGDPERVTIFGQGCGASSSGLHLLLPGSSDLFRNAILHSGNPVMPRNITLPARALDNALSFARRAKCPDKPEERKETLTCLQKLSPEELVDVVLNQKENALEWSFKPVLDGKILPNYPERLLPEGRFSREKSVMVGHVKGDGGYLLPYRFPEKEIEEHTIFSENEFKDVIQRTADPNFHVSTLVTDLVMFLYTNGNSSVDRGIFLRNSMVRYMTDRYFACTSLNTAGHLSAKGNNVFLYQFDHMPSTREIMPFKLPSWMGSTHQDELLFLFGRPLKFSHQYTLEEQELSKQVMRYWANFARNDDPNELSLPKWPKFSSEKIIMRIDLLSKMAGGISNEKECMFWEELFPRLHNPQQ